MIPPAEYHEDEKAIVRLETEYQIGEDAKLDYGPLEKYLKAKRLQHSLEYEIGEVADMMSEGEGDIKRLLRIMDWTSMRRVSRQIRKRDSWRFLARSSGTRSLIPLELDETLGQRLPST